MPYEKGSINRVVQRKVKAKLDKFVQIIFEESQKNCPVVTGRLKASWFQTMTLMSDQLYRERLGYKVPYAKRVDQQPGFSRGYGFFSMAVITARQQLRKGATK
ncbi:MAG: hypothetical protein PHP92_05555 [Candidatus Nanoarchaeia archaeon]|nr:hypothetical protein [Candidatus Nanoarchaeia archaeon]